MEELQGQQLKNRTITSTLWKFFERILARLVSLLVSIVLARLLTPDDYSVVGIVAIFFAFANTFISGGFNTALIQKKECDIEDYSSVLFLSLIAATFVYALLFFLSPFISELYNKPILTLVFRVMGITLFINAFKSVLCAYISKHLQFRKFFFATLIGTLISAVVGIVMATQGFGPWALVAQQMTNAILDTLILYFSTRVKFVFKISKDKSLKLFKYAWKLLVASEISVLYDEINPLIIGVKFSGADLSFYTKGKSFPSLLNSTVGETLSAVLFPVLSKKQDDKTILLAYTRKFIQIASFVIFPIMIGFIMIADNFILILLTEKWMFAVPYVQIFCVVYMFDMIQVGNLQVIRAVGRSDIFLMLEIIKKCLYAIVIIAFVFLTDNPMYLALACIINTFLALIINMTPNRKIIGYTHGKQLLDILPNLIMSLIMGACVYLIGTLSINPLVEMVIQIISGVLIYILGNLLIKSKNLQYVWNILKGLINRKKSSNQ